MAVKTVVIIGASSGIGEATAIRLAGEGHHVVVTARRVDRLLRITQQVASAGGRATAMQVDVTDRAAVADLVDKVVAESDRLDVVS